jgi:Type II secretion system (T2SS), protein E, N-terminal domain
MVRVQDIDAVGRSEAHFSRAAADRDTMSDNVASALARGAERPATPPQGVTPPSASGGRNGVLSDVIVELGFAERDAVEQAVRAARSPGTTVASVLVESGTITEEQLAHATAERHGVAYVDLGGFAVEAGAANLIKPSAAKRYQAVPVGFVGGGLLVAMADPADALGVSDIAAMTKMEVKPAVASRPALEALLEALPLSADLEDVAPSPAPDEPEAAPDGTALSAAVFLQAGEADAGGVQDDLPDSDGDREEHRTQATEEPGEADRLRAELAALSERLTTTEAELDQAGARARNAELAAAAVGEELDAAGEELDLLRERLAVAEADQLQTRAEAEKAERVRRDMERRIEELEDADRRAEQARQALTEMREETERQREQQMIDERELRERLALSEGKLEAYEARVSAALRTLAEPAGE